MKIVIKDLFKKYSDNPVLENLSLTIEKGQRVALIGLSGSGKTTLLRCINGFVTPDSGTVYLNDEAVNFSKTKQLRKIRKKIGMVYQLFNLVERTSVLHNVLTGSLGSSDSMLESAKKSIGFFSKKDKKHAMELLSFVKLEDKAKTRIDKLSGGQKQRVSIARALMQNPQVLLADEPIASLDISTGKKILKLFNKINHKEKITLVMVIHHIEMVSSEYFDRVIGLKAGQIVFDGSADDINDDVKTLLYGNEWNHKHTVEEIDFESSEEAQYA